VSHTPEQRSAYAKNLGDLIREWIVEREAGFELEIKRGVDWCREVTSDTRTPRPNETFTIVLRINGGAEQREGAPIVRTPGIAGPPQS
jgi:hypothetical protein